MSKALRELRLAVPEVQTLLDAMPPIKRGVSTNPDLTKALSRSSVLLLNSHLEQYVRALNDEAVSFVNAAGTLGSALPCALRLKHSREPIDVLARANWDNREDLLAAFVASDGALWSNGTSTLEAARLFQGFRSPKPKTIVQYFKAWAIADIFTEITRVSSSRSDLWLRIQSLADKRNSIAHGDANESATTGDIRKYRKAVLTFAERTDRVFAHQVRSLCGSGLPWTTP